VFLHVFILFFLSSILIYSQDKPIARFSAENGARISSIAISSDERYMFVGNHIGVIWDLQKEQIISTLPFYSEPSVRASAFSPDSKKLLLSINNIDVILWDIDKNEKLYSIRVAEGNDYLNANWRPNLGPTHYVIFSRDGNTFYTASFNGILQSWDTKTGKEINHYIFDNSYLRELNLMNDRNEMLIEYGNGFFIYNFLTSEKRMKEEFGQCSLNKNRNFLLQRKSVDDTFSLHLFDVEKEIIIREKFFTKVAPPEFVELFPTGDKVLLSSASLEYLSSIYYSPRMILDVNTFDVIKTYPLNEKIDRNCPENIDDKLMIFPNGKKFLTINGINVHIWDTSNLVSGINDFKNMKQ